MLSIAFNNEIIIFERKSERERERKKENDNK